MRLIAINFELTMTKMRLIAIKYFNRLTALVFTNSISFDYFGLHRGTKQGDPLSPLLFVLAIEPLSIALRNNGKIEGIVRGGLTHTVSLYADDLLLYVTNPVTSVPEVLDVLEHFGKISGYKLNYNKSEYFPINKTAELYPNLPFKLSANSFTYLGVKVTKSYHHLFKNNFASLLEQTKKDIQRWSILPLSLIGRVNSIKMNVVPKYLYLFQAIPRFIPMSFFKAFSQSVCSFIWNSKAARIRKEFMERPKACGGLSLPNLRSYYWAANLNAISLWLKELDDTAPAWLQIELATSRPHSLHALLCASLPTIVNNVNGNVIVNQSLRILKQLKKCLGIQNISIYSPITNNHLFQPSLLDNGFKIWRDKGIHSIRDLYFENTFASFEQLSAKYELTNAHFFRYLQIRDFVRKKFPNFPNLPPLSCLDSLLKVNLLKRGRVSMIYAEIMNILSPSVSHIREEWVNDIGVTLSDEEWEMALFRVHASSICSRHALIQFKVLHRLHYSKVRLARIFPDINPVCDRCKQAPATNGHMLWSCPKLTEFWDSYFKTISQIYNYHIQPSSATAIFGITPCSEESNPPANLQRVIAFSSLLAKCAILFKWKDPKPPTHSQWIRDMMQNIKLEKIRCTLNGSMKKFHKTWDPFIQHVNMLPGLEL